MEIIKENFLQFGAFIWKKWAVANGIVAIEQVQQKKHHHRSCFCRAYQKMLILDVQKCHFSLPSEGTQNYARCACVLLTLNIFFDIFSHKMR